MVKILIIDHVIPTPDQDAGSLIVWFFLKILKEKGVDITFIPKNLTYCPKYTEQLKAIGVNCLNRPDVDNIVEYLKSDATKFDVVMLYRVFDGGDFYELVREYAPDTKIIFNTVDLHFLRQAREAKMKGNEDKSVQMMASAMETKKRELFLIEHADVSIVLSEYEQKYLIDEYSLGNTKLIPLAFEVPGKKNSFDKRSGIAFFGGYQHTPNVDAIDYFVGTIWERLRERLPNVEFFIIGSKPPEKFIAYADKYKGVNLVGFVEELDLWMEKIKLTVAPLRYGAGIKGKIGSSLSFGVPCIASHLATEGMGLEDNVNIIKASGDDEWIDKIVSTYEDGKQWNELSENGIAFVESKFSINVISERLNDLFFSVGIDITKRGCEKVLY